MVLVQLTTVVLVASVLAVDVTIAYAPFRNAHLARGARELLRGARRRT